ncbi:MAG: FAD-dependent oxidoreductase [Alphaproteobacteria bacterium]|nr:FAD-dependent oxidoreductase [Alphaproteobacteria bacterium]
MKKVLIIGGGFAGCSAAHLLTLQGGWDITLIDSAPVLGGGCKTLWYGGHPYTFGPRHFLTQNETVYGYLDKYCPLRRCNDHVFLTYVHQDDQFYNYPVHVDDVTRMPEAEQIRKELGPILDERHRTGRVEGAANAKDFEDYWVSSIGQTLYDKFIDKYSQKMWMVEDNKTIDTFSWSPKGSALKEGPREAWDTAMSAYPYAANGYDDYFDLATAGAKVMLNTKADSYDIPAKTVTIKGEKRKFDVIINTLSPDIVMNFAYGELPYVGRDFYPFVLPIKHAFPENVYFLYYAGNEKFTRIVEYKQFTRQRYDDDSTILGIEIPSKDGRYYPLPLKSEYARAKRYFDDMPEGVFSIGRAGSYEYRVDADDCIEQAMDATDKLK